MKDAPTQDDGKQPLGPSSREKFADMSDDQLRRYLRHKSRLGGGVEAGAIEEAADRIGRKK